MITPPYLQKGDKIAIIATARKITLNEIKGAISLLKEWQFEPVVGKTIGLEEYQLAGTDIQRAEDLQQAIDNPEIKAIWCARGGYGTVRIIDEIDFSSMKTNPKWLIGYSDVTVLHSHLHTLGIATLHAPMLFDLLNNSLKVKNEVLNAISGKSISYPVNYASYNVLGKGEGVCIGGNLSILYSLCGSVSQVDTRGKILFIEDLDEYLYHVDRMFLNLKRNGMLSDLNGLIVGGMTKMHDNAISFGKTVEEIILDHVKEYDYPVIFDFPAGHLNDNYPIILGQIIHIDVRENEVNISHSIEK